MIFRRRVEAKKARSAGMRWVGVGGEERLQVLGGHGGPVVNAAFVEVVGELEQDVDTVGDRLVAEARPVEACTPLLANQVVDELLTCGSTPRS